MALKYRAVLSAFQGERWMVWKTAVWETEADDDSALDAGGYDGFLSATELAGFFAGTGAVGWAHMAGLGGVRELDKNLFVLLSMYRCCWNRQA